MPESFAVFSQIGNVRIAEAVCTRVMAYNTWAYEIPVRLWPLASPSESEEPLPLMLTAGECRASHFETASSWSRFVVTLAAAAPTKLFPCRSKL